jgi:hypothetical protein
MTHPCLCEICEKARYSMPCPGCGEHPSFWRTVVESPQWQAWMAEQARRMEARYIDKTEPDAKVYDMFECMELGCISPGHWQEFLDFGHYTIPSS